MRAMFRAIVCLLLFCSPLAAATQILDTIKYPDGTNAVGRVDISWTAFTTGAGSSIAAGNTTVTIKAGVLDVTLEANDTSTPVTYYNARFALSRGNYIQTWLVPTSATPKTVGQVVVTTSTTATVNIAQLNKANAVKGDLIAFGTDWTIFTGGTNGQVLTKDSTQTLGVKWGTVSGTGTVTSVGLSAPVQFSVSGSPVTTSGTLALAWANQTANTILAGPSSGAAAVPTFRTMVDADIPVTMTGHTLAGVTTVGDGVGNDNLSFTEEATNPGCVVGDYRIWASSADGKFKKCETGTITDLDTGGAGGASTADAFITIGHPADLTAERNLVAGAGLVLTDGGANGDATLATDSTETDFLGVAALTCGAGTKGRASIPGVSLTFCDNQATPVLQTVANRSDNLSVFAATTSAQLAGVISDETGTGAVVLAVSPTLTGTVTVDRRLEFTEAAGDPACAAGDFWISATSTSNVLRKCQNGSLSDLDTGAAGGDSVSVNGAAATDADLDDATPTAPANKYNVKWQKDALSPNNVSAYVDPTLFTAPIWGAGADFTWTFDTVTAGTSNIVASFTATNLNISTGGLQVGGSAVATSANNLSFFAATTSAQLAGVISDETGTGVLVFGTAPAFTTSITTPVVISGAADPADAGAIRLGNGEVIGWEASPAGTDVTLSVDASEIFQFSSSVSITGNLTVTGTIDSGDGTVAGESIMRELSANGTEYRSWLAPDALAAILRMRFANAVPTAGQVMRFGTPAANISDQTWGDAGGVGACAANQFETGDNNNAAPTCAQPSFTNLSGTATKAQLPAAVAYEDEANSFTGGLQTINSGTTSANVLLIDIAQPGVAGQRDSHDIRIRGTAFDTVGHSADWLAFVDVTSNAGASTFTIQSRIDASSFANRLTLTDAGLLNVTTLTEGGSAVPNSTDNLSFFSSTTSAQLAGVISDETGTGVLVLGTSPVISTSLSQDGDVADAGYLRLQNAALIAWEASPAGTDITLTVDASEVMQASGAFNAVTLTEGGNAVPNSTDNLSFFAATTSAQLAGVISDETGTGVLVFGTAPSFTTSITTPVILSGAADPADAGVIRLGNAELIAWEASPAGADVTLTVDASEVMQASGTFNAATLTEGANAVPNSTDHLGFFAATTSAQLAGVISDETGTGVLVFGTSPVISTSLSQDGDVADAGYLRLQNAAIIGWEASPAGTDITLTVDASEIMQASGTFNAVTLTEGGNAVPNSTDHLGFFAATTSAQFAGVISDETGTGAVVLAASPTLTGTVTVNRRLEFTEAAGDPACAAGDFWISATSTSNVLRKCQNGSISDLDTGGAGGDNISVNGTAATDADFDDATPAAPADGVNVRWQKDALSPNNVSANLQFATASLAGAVSTAAQTFAGAKTINNKLTLAMDPPASATESLLQLGATAIAGGSTAGTFIGANPAAFTGRIMDFQVAGVQRLFMDMPPSGWLARFETAGGYTWSNDIGAGTDKLTINVNGSSTNVGRIRLGSTGAGTWFEFGPNTGIKFLIRDGGSCAGATVVGADCTGFDFRVWNQTAASATSFIVRGGATQGSTRLQAWQNNAGVEQAGMTDTGVLDVLTGYRIGGAAASNAVLRGNGTNFVSAGAMISSSSSLDFGSIIDGACATLTFTLTGAATGDDLAPGWPSTLETGLHGTMLVSSANTVQVRLCNLSGASVNPAAQTFAAMVVR